MTALVRAPQLSMFAGSTSSTPAVHDKPPPPTEAEKHATRARQRDLCATCGGVSKHGRKLDVVRTRSGKLLAYCLRHRLHADAGDRCHKAAGRRRHRAKPHSKPGQRQICGI